MFGGSRRLESRPRAPKSRQELPRTSNIASTWGQHGVQEGVPEGQKFIKIQGRLPKSAPDAPRPPQDPFWEGFGEAFGVYFGGFWDEVWKVLRYILDGVGVGLEVRESLKNIWFLGRVCTCECE